MIISGANQFLGRLQDFKFFAETLTNRYFVTLSIKFFFFVKVKLS